MAHIFDFNIGDTVIFRPDFFIFEDPRIITCLIVDRDTGFDEMNPEYRLLGGSPTGSKYQWHAEYHLDSCRMILTEKRLNWKMII